MNRLRNSITTTVSLLALTTLCALSTREICYFYHCVFLIAVSFYFYCTHAEIAPVATDNKLRNILIAIIVLCIAFSACEQDATMQALRFIGLPETGLLSRVLRLILCILAFPYIKRILSCLDNESNDRDSIAHFLSSRKFLILCSCIAGAGIISMLTNAFRYTFSCDEVATLYMIQGSYSHLMECIYADVHPPFYYLYLKAFIDNVQTLFPEINPIYSGKLASVIPFILLYLICLTWVRRHIGNIAGGIAAVAICCIPKFLEYGVTIRMYSLAGLFVVLCYIQAYRVLQNNNLKQWIIFAFYGLLAAYTHYWACIAVSLVFIYTGVWSVYQGRATFGKWIIACGICVLAYIPWLSTLIYGLREVSVDSWLGGVTWRTIVRYNMLQCSDIITVWMLISVLVASVFLLMKESISRRKIAHALVGIFVPYWVMVCAFVISILHAPSFGLHQIVPAAICMWMGVGMALPHIKNRRHLSALVLTILSVSVINICVFNVNEGTEERATIDFVNDVTRTDNAVLVTSNSELYPTMIMLANKPCYVIKNRVRDYSIITFGERYHAISKADEIREFIDAGHTIYYVGYGDSIRDFAEQHNLEIEDMKYYKLRMYSPHLCRIKRKS